MMRTNIVIFFFCALFFTIFSVRAQTPASARPAEINFGDLRLGTTRDTVYRFDVVGAPAVIMGVNVDCVCTKVKWDRKPVAAGAQGVLGVSYKAKEPGLFYKTITVTLSDPRRSFKVIVRGRVL